MKNTQPPFRARYAGHDLLVSAHRDPEFSLDQIGIHEAQAFDGSLPPMFVLFDREARRVLEVPGKGTLSHARERLEWLDNEIHVRFMQSGDPLFEEEDESEARRKQCAAEVLAELYPGATAVVVELPSGPLSQALQGR